MITLYNFAQDSRGRGEVKKDNLWDAKRVAQEKREREKSPTSKEQKKNKCEDSRESNTGPQHPRHALYPHAATAAHTACQYSQKWTKLNHSVRLTRFITARELSQWRHFSQIVEDLVLEDGLGGVGGREEVVGLAGQAHLQLVLVQGLVTRDWVVDVHEI